MHYALIAVLLSISGVATPSPLLVWRARPEARGVAATFTSAGKRVIVADERGGLSTFDAVTGKPVGRHPGGRGKGYAARFAPDAKRIAWGDQGGGLILDDLTTNERLAMLIMPFDGKRRPRPLIVWSADGKRVARASGDTARVWDVATHQELATVRAAKPKDQPERGELTGLALSADGSRLATSDPHALQIHVVPTGTRRAASWVGAGAVSFSPDGARVIAAGPKSAVAAGAGFLTIWDADKMTALGGLPGDAAWKVAQLAVSPDGKWLAFAYAGESRVMFWDLAARHLAGSPDAQVGRVASLGFDAGSGRVVVLGAGGDVSVLRAP